MKRHDYNINRARVKMIAEAVKVLWQDLKEGDEFHFEKTYMDIMKKLSVKPGTQIKMIL